jgi:ATP-dependent RNA helicase DeaD
MRGREEGEVKKRFKGSECRGGSSWLGKPRAMEGEGGQGRARGAREGKGGGGRAKEGEGGRGRGREGVREGQGGPRGQ